jgi:hypothetical protein
MSIHFHERFLEYLPRLLSDATFRDKIIKELGKAGPDVLARVQNNLPIDDEDELFDAARNVYSNCAENILTLAWDGDFPGNSGVLSLGCCAGVYVISSTDYDDLGPFTSLDEALQDEHLNTVTANPELNSEVLPNDELLEIAARIVDWENEGTIRINSELYQVSDNKLILSAED